MFWAISFPMFSHRTRFPPVISFPRLMNSTKALDWFAAIFTALVFALSHSPDAFAAVHVWEKQELTFASTNSYANPYTDVVTWVDLKGPGFSRRIYGFWDGGRSFKVRLVATQPGRWTWISGSQPHDPGLAGKRGSLDAIAWTDEEKKENSL